MRSYMKEDYGKKKRWLMGVEMVTGAQGKASKQRIAHCNPPNPVKKEVGKPSKTKMGQVACLSWFMRVLVSPLLL
jgi:hypothetical protein